MTTQTSTPAGWYPDPDHRHQYRYWDGAEWTPQVADGGAAAIDPTDEGAVHGPPETAPQPTAVPTRRPTFWSRHPVAAIWVVFVFGAALLAEAMIGIITMATEDCTQSGSVVECQSGGGLTTTVNLPFLIIAVVVGILAVVRGVFMVRARRAARK